MFDVTWKDVKEGFALVALFAFFLGAGVMAVFLKVLFVVCPGCFVYNNVSRAVQNDSGYALNAFEELNETWKKPLS